MQNKCQWSGVGKKQRQREKKKPKLKGCRKNKKTSASMAKAK